jgi:GNAT superfamily N-acetyltransferase
MELVITKVALAEIQSLRNLFLAESKFQFIYNKCHGAGWADTYLFTMDGINTGYGSLWGKDKREDRDDIFEFYLLPPYRKHAGKIFTEFHKASEALFIKCQSNDIFLANMLYEYGKDINAEAILFEDAVTTEMSIAGTDLRKNEGPEGDIEYILEWNSHTVATGGYVWNYNFPYIDIYYEVKEEYRQRGFGSLITQELKKEAYRLNRVPAARCNVGNKASKATLLKAGMRICGHILVGSLATALP